MIVGLPSKGTGNPLTVQQNIAGLILVGPTLPGMSALGDVRGSRVQFPFRSPDVAAITLDVTEAGAGQIRGATPAAAVPVFVNGAKAGHAGTGTFTLGGLTDQGKRVIPLLSLAGDSAIIDMFAGDVDLGALVSIDPDDSLDIAEFQIFRGDGPGDSPDLVTPVKTLDRSVIFGLSDAEPILKSPSRTRFPTLTTGGAVSGSTLETTGRFTVEIDGGGDLDTATYRYRRAPDPFWIEESLPVSGAYQALGVGVFITFAGENCLLGDRWVIEWGVERTWLDETVKSGTWNYSVVAVDTTGNTSSLGSAQVAIQMLPPSPTNLDCQETGGTVRVTWDYDVTDESLIDGFVICANYGIESEYPDTRVPVSWDGRLELAGGRVDPDVRLFDLGSILSNPGLWRITVLAFSGADTDENWNYCEIRISDGHIRDEPDAPMLISATPQTGGDVDVVIRVNADNTTLVRLYTDAGLGDIDYSTNVGEVVVSGSALVSQTVTFDESDLLEGVDNKLAVRSVSSSGYEEENIEFISATPDKTAPGTPVVIVTGG